MADNQKSLDECRQAIDGIDEQIIHLFNERMKFAQQIGDIKRRNGDPVYVPSREESIFKKLAAFSEGPLGAEAIRAIYREIFSASIALQQEIRVAYLGPEATYTHQAAIKNFGSQFEMLPHSTIFDVFQSVERGKVNYGVVPIENSTEGSVFHTMDMLVESDVKIISQIHLPIEHALISSGNKDTITTVLSKDQALGQCRSWLRQYLPNATLENVSSTGLAVQMAKDDPTKAAIAGELSGRIHGVPVLYRNIQDSSENITRFLVISQNQAPTQMDGDCRTSFVLSLRDEPGTLEKALDCFSKRNINLSKIESRPSRKKAWDYYFFIDLQGHVLDGQVKEATAELEKICPLVKWLGSYPN